MQAAYVIFIVLAGMAWAGPIEDLQPGCWYEVPGSHLSAVAPSRADYPEIQGGEGVSGVMNDWASGALDTKRNRLYVTGGGHWGYFGNELYAFDLDSLKWLRLTDPSPLVPNTDTVTSYPYDSTCPDDSVPCSCHTYDGIEYIPPPVDRLFLMGHPNYGYVATDAWIGKRAYLFHPDSFSWKALAVYGFPGDDIIGMLTAADEVTGKVFMHTTASYSRFSSYEAAADSWNYYVFPDATNGWFGYNFTASIDPVSRVMVASGEGKMWAWNISAPSSTTSRATRLTVNGDTTAMLPNNPAFDYDSQTGRFVAWVGGTDAYSFDYGTRTWTKHFASSANTVTPTTPNTRGTFGRFRYVPSKDVFVVANRVDDNVYIYRLPEEASRTDRERTASALISFSASPNPFNPSTVLRIRYGAPDDGRQAVGLKVFGIDGRLVKDLSFISPSPSSAAGRSVQWDASKTPSGLYVARLTVGKTTLEKRLALVR